jgi:hypothetical protein
MNEGPKSVTSFYASKESCGPVSTIEMKDIDKKFQEKYITGRVCHTRPRSTTPVRKK